VDDYQKEITDLERQLEDLVEDEGDKEVIADLSMQLEILKALYARAFELYQRGEHDPNLRNSLAMRGYGAWNFDNVYAFVYEQAVELPGGHAAFVGGIRDTDFAGLLQASA
jgi:hypothetical protein